MICKLQNNTLYIYFKEQKVISNDDIKELIRFLFSELQNKDEMANKNKLKLLAINQSMINSLFDLYSDIIIVGSSKKAKVIDTITKQDFIYINNLLKDFWISLDKYFMVRSKKHSISFNSRLTNALITLLKNAFLSFQEMFIPYDTEAFNSPSFMPKAVIATSLEERNLPTDYQKLNQIETIVKVQINTPFISRTSANTRTGLFSSLEAPYDFKQLPTNEFYLIGVKVGRLLMHIYFHQYYLHHGISLFNLFEKASLDEMKNNTPSGILFFGIDDRNFNAKYYYDKKNKIYSGYIHRGPKNDYFGYMKKMLLTLYNLFYIEKKALPLHGAMVSIQLMDDSIKNIIIIGDSGAGKSETIEAFRLIGQTMIRKMKIVFDDMGILEIIDDNIVASGTEIGAFVRIDDLESGYAFKYLNDAMLVNPERVNARLIMKVTDYETVIKNHNVDIILYANNYDVKESKLKIFKSPEEAIEVFARGQRLAKGTTTEMGMVKNFFANPFGPVQRQKTVLPMMREYFKILFDKNIIVGELYTQLAIDGYEFEGPRQAATSLIDYFNCLNHS